jgi:hypothetical protein
LAGINQLLVPANACEEAPCFHEKQTESRSINKDLNIEIVPIHGFYKAVNELQDPDFVLIVIDSENKEQGGISPVYNLVSFILQE